MLGRRGLAALVCAVFLPLRFRDLPEASLFKHEGQHLGWINAVLFGKWMMADTSGERRTSLPGFDALSGG